MKNWILYISAGVLMSSCASQKYSSSANISDDVYFSKKDLVAYSNEPVENSEDQFHYDRSGSGVNPNAEPGYREYRNNQNNFQSNDNFRFDDGNNGFINQTGRVSAMPQVTVNYVGFSNPFYNPFYTPFNPYMSWNPYRPHRFRRPGWHFSFNSWGGWQIGYGFNPLWGNPYAFHNPWVNPWFNPYSNPWSNPWSNPYAWNNPWHNPYSNPWAWNNPWYNPWNDPFAWNNPWNNPWAWQTGAVGGGFNSGGGGQGGGLAVRPINTGVKRDGSSGVETYRPSTMGSVPGRRSPEAGVQNGNNQNGRVGGMQEPGNINPNRNPGIRPGSDNPGVVNPGSGERRQPQYREYSPSNPNINPGTPSVSPGRDVPSQGGGDIRNRAPERPENPNTNPGNVRPSNPNGGRVPDARNFEDRPQSRPSVPRYDAPPTRNEENRRPQAPQAPQRPSQPRQESPNFRAPQPSAPSRGFDAPSYNRPSAPSAPSRPAPSAPSRPAPSAPSNGGGGIRR